MTETGKLESLRRWNKRGTGSQAEKTLQLDHAIDALEAAQARERVLEAENAQLFEALDDVRATARREALEEVIAVLNRHDSVPCKPAFPDAWSDEALEHYTAGQLDAAISWQTAIRALMEKE